jgi:hypothetical protein
VDTLGLEDPGSPGELLELAMRAALKKAAELWAVKKRWNSDSPDSDLLGRD